jgi:hypothetical protein
MEAIDDLSSKIIDIFDYTLHSYVSLFVLVIVITVILYLGKSNANSSDSSIFSTSSSYNLTDPNITSSNESSTFGINTFSIIQFIMTFGIFTLLVWLIYYVTKYIFDVDVINALKNIFADTKTEVSDAVNKIDDKIEDKIDDIKDEIKDNLDKKIEVKVVSTPKNKEEVFNVSKNLFTYNDAPSVCKAYNARLATYQEVEDSYNAGGEWCNYGWSENQMALFPTQKNTYDKLQKTDDHKNDCGRPGVNGGFIENSELKFGVNCYGVKPKMTSKEEELMKTIKEVPKNEKEMEMEKKVSFWKENLDKVLLMPFNHDKWSRL